MYTSSMATEERPFSQRGANESPTVHEATVLLRMILSLSEDFGKYMEGELTVNPTDMSAMNHLLMSGPMSPTQLAKRLGVSTAAATVITDRLTKVGHVSRAPHPTDRRGIVITPEPASVAKAMGALMPMVMGIDQVISDFDNTEQDAITRYLRRVVEVYRESIPTGEAGATQ